MNFYRRFFSIRSQQAGLTAAAVAQPSPLTVKRVK